MFDYLDLSLQAKSVHKPADMCLSVSQYMAELPRDSVPSLSSWDEVGSWCQIFRVIEESFEVHWADS